MELTRNGRMVRKKFLEYFFPTVLIALANNLAILIDSVIVGNMLGSVPMAAISLMSPITQIYFSTAILFGLGTSTLISYAKCKNEKEEADLSFSTGVLLLALAIVLFMLVQFLFLHQIVNILTDIEELRVNVVSYYIPFIVGTPFNLVLASATHVIRSDARPKFASFLIILSNAINLIFDVILMGPFHMGIAGSSIATVIGNVTAFVFLMGHFFSKHNTLHLCKIRLQAFLKQAGSILSIGLSGALGTMLMTLSIYVMNDLVQEHAGVNGMVAMSVISNAQVFISAFITGASQTTIPLVSAFLGQRDDRGIQYAFNTALMVLLSIALLVVVLIEIFPGPVALLFGKKTAEQMAVIIPALRIAALAFPGMALNFLYMYYCTAIQQKTIAVSISILNGALISIPAAYLLSTLFSEDGLWWTFALTQYTTLACAMAFAYGLIKTSRGKRKNLYLLEEDNKASASFSFDEKTREELARNPALLVGAAAEKKISLEKLQQEKLSEFLEEMKTGSGLYDLLIFDENEPVLLLRTNQKPQNENASSVLGMNAMQYDTKGIS